MCPPIPDPRKRDLSPATQIRRTLQNGRRALDPGNPPHSRDSQSNSPRELPLTTRSSDPFNTASDTGEVLRIHSIQHLTPMTDPYDESGDGSARFSRHCLHSGFPPVPLRLLCLLILLPARQFGFVW